MRITSKAVRDELIRSLADEYSRKIILGSISKAQSVEELAHAENIPISTAYRRINEMKNVGIPTVEKTVLTEAGKNSRCTEVLSRKSTRIFIKLKS
jgi:hypothetical protein